MNKKVKIILGIIITMLIICGVIFFINYNKVSYWGEPITDLNNNEIDILKKQ